MLIEKWIDLALEYRLAISSGIEDSRMIIVSIDNRHQAAERQTQRFVVDDKFALRTLDELYELNTPIQENTTYIERAKQIRAAQDAAIRGKVGGFSYRNERGWLPSGKPIPDNHDQ